MALNTNAITTLAKVKTFLGIGVSTYDTLLEDIINSVSQFIESQTSNFFKQKTVTNEVYNGTGSPDLVLKHSKIISVTTVEYRSGGTLGSPTWTAISSDDYSLDEGEGNIYYPSGWSYGRQNYRVTYVAGFATIPSDLDMLCQKLSARYFDQRRSQGKLAEGIDGANVNWATNIDSYDKQTLSLYKNWQF